MKPAKVNWPNNSPRCRGRCSVLLTATCQPPSAFVKRAALRAQGRDGERRLVTLRLGGGEAVAMVVERE